MSVPAPTSPRPWREIAAEITQEQDSRKMLELVLELDRALEIDAQEKPGHTRNGSHPS